MFEFRVEMTKELDINLYDVLQTLLERDKPQEIAEETINPRVELLARQV